MDFSIFNLNIITFFKFKTISNFSVEYLRLFKMKLDHCEIENFRLLYPLPNHFLYFHKFFSDHLFISMQMITFSSTVRNFFIFNPNFITFKNPKNSYLKFRHRVLINSYSKQKHATYKFNILIRISPCTLTISHLQILK